MIQQMLVILMGLQGSGKSTFYKTHLDEDFVRVNLDTLKTRHQEHLLIEECLTHERNFAVDNTNPTRLDRQRYIIPAKKAGYRIVGYFLESKIKDCMQRNALRKGKARVPEKAIAATSNKLEIPSYEEGFDELYFVKNNGETMTIEEWRK
jgi:predicted kinase